MAVARSNDFTDRRFLRRSDCEKRVSAICAPLDTILPVCEMPPVAREGAPLENQHRGGGGEIPPVSMISWDTAVLDKFYHAPGSHMDIQKYGF